MGPWTGIGPITPVLIAGTEPVSPGAGMESGLPESLNRFCKGVGLE